MNLEERTRYPKTDHLWMRFENPPKMRGIMRRGHYSHSEFNFVKFWYTQEKIDGSNLRVMLRHVGGRWCVDLFTREGTDYNISWKGARTFLREKFTLDRIFSGIDKEKIDTSSIVVFYGELFGAGINKDGELYSDELEYAVFDIKIDDWWLTPEQVIDVVHKMGIRHAPIISEMMTIDDIVSFVSSFPDSRIDPRHELEGVVCRASPMFMFKGTNNPVQFKLKAREMRSTIAYEQDQRKFK